MPNDKAVSEEARGGRALAFALAREEARVYALWVANIRNNSSGTSTSGTAGTWHAWTTGITTTTSATHDVFHCWVQGGMQDAWAHRRRAVKSVQAATSPRQQWERSWRKFLADLGIQVVEDASKRRARQLLVEALTAEQRKTYEIHGWFVVEVEGVRYRIDQGTHGNVKELDRAGRPLAKYCIQPDGVPDCDAMLAQKLMLETDIASFKRIANRTPFYE